MTTIAACMQPIVLEHAQLYNLLTYVLDIEDDEDVLSLTSLVELFNSQHSHRTMCVDYWGRRVQIIAWVDDLDDPSTKVMLNSLSTLNVNDTVTWLTHRGAVFTPGLAHVENSNVNIHRAINVAINDGIMTKLDWLVTNQLYPHSRNSQHIGLAYSQTIAVLQFGNTFAWFERSLHETNYTLQHIYQVDGHPSELQFIVSFLLPVYMNRRRDPGILINPNGDKTVIRPLE